MDLSAPLHLQALERFLDVNRLLKEVEEAVHDPVQTIKYSWNDEDFDDDEILVDIDHRPDDKYIYDMSELTEDNIWLKQMLMSDSSDSSDDEEITETDMRRILRRYKAMKKVTESIRHQSTQYSGYSTSILATSDIPFQLDLPEDDIDYNSETQKRGKRVKRRKKKSTPPPQLTIRDMIDALTTGMDSPLPDELIIENGKDHTTLELEEIPKRKDPEQVWKSVVEEAYIFSRKRKYKLELHSCKRAKICSEIQRGPTKLKPIRPMKQEQEIITILDDQFEDHTPPCPNLAQTFNMKTDNDSLGDSTEGLELPILSMDVQINDVSCDNIGIVAVEPEDNVERDTSPEEHVVEPEENVVAKEVGRDTSPVSDTVSIVDLEDIADVEDIVDVDHVGDVEDIVDVDLVDDVEDIVDVDHVGDVEEEISNMIKECVAETIEISEADIFDQSEIVNKKKEEIAAALKILENKIRQEQARVVPTEEIEFTEEDILEDIITFEDLVTPDVSEETFKYKEVTESQTGETTTETTEDNNINSAEEGNDKVIEDGNNETIEEFSNNETTEENNNEITEENNNKITEENNSKTTVESNKTTVDKTTEESNKTTTEDKAVLAKKCLSDIVSSVPEML